MPASPSRRPRVLRARGWWIAVAVALSAAVFLVLALRGASESQVGRGALAPGGEAEASAREDGGAALESAPSAPDAATALDAPEPAGTRKALTAAKARPEDTIVVGFVVVEAAHSQPLNAWRASVSFGLERGDERWSGRVLKSGLRLVDARREIGDGRLDSASGADEFVCLELDPKTPRGVPIAFDVELSFRSEWETLMAVETRHHGTYRGKGTLTLSGAPYQRLPDVQCRQMGAWAAGTVVAGPHIDLAGASVELFEVAYLAVEGETASPGGGIVTSANHISKAAAASAPVLADRTFSVPGPSGPTLPRMQLCVVLADGRTFPQSTCEAYSSGIVLRVAVARIVKGQLLFRGAPAHGLARVHAEQGGADVGHATVERDGTFTIGGAPYGAFDVVIDSGRPYGELARFPLASLTGNIDASTLDVGVIDVAGHAVVMELELVDRSGAPAAAQLRWSGRGGSGNASLKAAEVHTLLMPAVVQFDMELVPPLPGAPVALEARPGRVRVVVGE